MRISDWSSDVCSSDLRIRQIYGGAGEYAGDADERQFCRFRLDRAGRSREFQGAEAQLLFRAHLGSTQEPGENRWGNDRLGAAAQSPSAYRSEEHTSELQSLMRISYAVFCLKKTKIITAL